MLIFYRCYYHFGKAGIMILCMCMLIALIPELQVCGQNIEGRNSDSVVYSPDMWVEIPDMPAGRLSHSCVTHENSIYFFGGHYRISGDNWAYPESIIVYDPASNSWDIVMESSPISRVGINAFNIDGLAYLIGGIRFQHGNWGLFIYNSIDVLDLEQMTWYSRASFPGYDVGSGCRIGDAIYITGGIDKNRDPLHSTFRYDIANDTWSQEADMQVARFGHTVVSLDGKMYCIGGICQNNSGTEDVGTRVAEVYDPETNTWQFIDSLPVPGFAFSPFVYQNRIFLAGGVFTADPENGTAEEISDKIFMYAEDAGEWKVIGYLPEPRTHFPSVVMDDMLYIFGGYTREYGDAIPTCRKLDLSAPLLSGEHKISYRLYPNPTTGAIQTRGLQNFHYSLITLEGRTIQTGVLEQHECRLDLAHLQPGIYLISLYNETDHFCEKLIIRSTE